MADTFWTGKAIYNSNTERDLYGKRVEDFIEARLNVVPHPNSSFTTDPSGVEYRNLISIDTDSGPGFIWSIKLPTGDPVITEAQTLEATITDPALNSYSAFVA